AVPFCPSSFATSITPGCVRLSLFSAIARISLARAVSGPAYPLLRISLGSAARGGGASSTWRSADLIGSETESVSALSRRLAAAGYAVLGLSPDKPEKLAKFRERDGLTFPLLSDQDKKVLEAYGAYGEKKLYGKVVVGVIRSTFVVGEDGKIELAQYAVKATG